jgi:hypothetical protein
VLCNGAFVRLFFFGWFLFSASVVVVLGDALPDCGVDDESPGRRALNDEINSRTAGESPNKFLRCSALAGFDRPAEYVTICVRDSSSSGKSLDSAGTAHATRLLDMIWAIMVQKIP